MSSRTVDTVRPRDPVIIESEPWEPSQLRLRIGPSEVGRTRLATLTRSQALKIAINLLRAVDELS